MNFFRGFLLSLFALSLSLHSSFADEASEEDFPKNTYFLASPCKSENLNSFDNAKLCLDSIGRVVKSYIKNTRQAMKCDPKKSDIDVLGSDANSASMILVIQDSMNTLKKTIKNNKSNPAKFEELGIKKQTEDLLAFLQEQLKQSTPGITLKFKEN